MYINKRLFFVAAIICLVGCASIKYTAPTGETFKYSRLGTQKISGLKIIKDQNGLLRFQVESQEGTEGQLVETIKEVLKKIP
jgi:hypothetical protein